MPIYEFECNKCGERFEVSMSFSDPLPESCPQDGCGGKVRKIFSPPAIIFKGSGFHVNDYGRSGPKSSATAGASGSSSATGES
ncbi:MAG: zinc ribbon domain-containing protein [candidate division WS1 bacterium]|jgi:putative FmdB family regulatory protein|nr:zinc ribbon domain-containing protein [candidate division WS1 bacterium]